MNIRIRPYDASLSGLWDRTVKGSFNGTFLHLRAYADYHADRFRDMSLMFFAGNEPVAVILAHREGDIWFSHKGLTYGGWIRRRTFREAEMAQMWKQCLAYLQNQGIRRAELREVPLFYAGYLTEADRRVYRQAGKVAERRAFWVIDSRKPAENLLNADRRRNLKKTRDWDLDIRITDRWADFWTLLENNLHHRHGARPVHTLDEIRLLHRRFPENIRLTGAFLEGKLIAGAVLYLTRRTLRFQYLSGSTEKHLRPAIDALVWEIIRNEGAKYNYIDLGSALLPDGTEDAGLVYWKQSFGAEPIEQYIWQFDVGK